MTIIGRNPLLMLFALPSLEAVRSSGGGQEAPDVPRQAAKPKIVDSKTDFDISHEEDDQEGSLCHLRWRHSEEHQEPLNYLFDRLQLWVHLDPKEKAFTYIKADSRQTNTDRYLSIKDNEDELAVSAFACARDLGTRIYPKVQGGPRGDDKRREVEEMLSEGGPFSPLGHLTKGDLDGLVSTIDWNSDSGDYKCEKIYDFLASNPPKGYREGSLDWLFASVNEKADRVYDKIGEKPSYEPIDLEKLAREFSQLEATQRLREQVERIETMRSIESIDSMDKKPSKEQEAAGGKKPSTSIFRSIGKSFTKLTKNGRKK
ncbi:hypothetical protein FOZ63_026833 [Perkinsus olseni]|uniref:Uncharacterized protein n=1 Tax=Perkinsus olseni TaxID=32597 RepID=A0A7J6RJM7_PEROL|nr:hypothetical protein FOZ62_013116 [Perkinsus olseni]KAF4727576.1 hypothetical protein FOZ63_026833 [Perkinsus olseni]